ncbi:MAG: hypothetical protein WC712_04665, partial [Candidatus Brocadiia bacterium]
MNDDSRIIPPPAKSNTKVIIIVLLIVAVIALGATYFVSENSYLRQVRLASEAVAIAKTKADPVAWIEAKGKAFDAEFCFYSHFGNVDEAKKFSADAIAGLTAVTQFTTDLNSAKSLLIEAVADLDYTKASKALKAATAAKTGAYSKIGNVSDADITFSQCLDTYKSACRKTGEKAKADLIAAQQGDDLPKRLALYDSATKALSTIASDEFSSQYATDLGAKDASQKAEAEATKFRDFKALYDSAVEKSAAADKDATPENWSIVVETADKAAKSEYAAIGNIKPATALVTAATPKFEDACTKLLADAGKTLADAKSGKGFDERKAKFTAAQAAADRITALATAQKFHAKAKEASNDAASCLKAFDEYIALYKKAEELINKIGDTEDTDKWKEVAMALRATSQCSFKDKGDLTELEDLGKQAAKAAQKYGDEMLSAAKKQLDTNPETAA